MNKVPVGAVCFLEIVTTEVERTCEWYTSQHGWQFGGPRMEFGGSQVATKEDGSLVSIRAPMSEQEQPTIRMYVRVDDLATAVAGLTDQGADVLLAKMEIPGQGYIAIYELGGIQHGLWQLPNN